MRESVRVAEPVGTMSLRPTTARRVAASRCSSSQRIPKVRMPSMVAGCSSALTAMTAQAFWPWMSRPRA